MGCFNSKSHPLPPYLTTPSSYHSEKLLRLQSPGVMVIVDVSNLEIEGQKLAYELRHHRPGLDPTWRLHYPHLLHLIATRANTLPPRPLVAAHAISSERHLVRNRFSPGRKTWARLGITLTIPSSRNLAMSRSQLRGHNELDLAFTRTEKAVDHTLVRIMTQEFEGLQLLHGDSAERPHRTIALVAGDFDYVDVVEQARLSGVDVEMWFWTGRTSLSTQWVREESRRHERLGTFAMFDLRDHFEHLTAEGGAAEESMELPGDRPDRLSFGSEASSQLARGGGVVMPGGVELGATGGRRVTGKVRRLRKSEGEVRAGSEGVHTPESSVLASEYGEMGRSVSEQGASSPFVRGGLLAGVDDESNERCTMMEFCMQERCTARHTEAERMHFRVHGGRGRYRLGKVKVCKGPQVCATNERKFGVCIYLHEGEDPLCVKCLKAHKPRECDVERMRPINPLEARPLVQEGYLVDLLMAKSTLGGPKPGKANREGRLGKQRQGTEALLAIDTAAGHEPIFPVPESPRI